MRLQTFDSNYFPNIGFFEDGLQKYLVFRPVFRYFKMVAITSKVTVWKSKGLSDEAVKPQSTSDNSLNPGVNYTGTAEIQLKFKGSCLKQEVTFTCTQMVNICISYELNFWLFTVGKDFDMFFYCRF